MAVRLRATIEGEEQLSRRLEGLDRGATDLRPAFEDIGDELLHSFDTNFDNRGALFMEGGWPRRSSNTPGTHPLMEKTGALRHSFDKKVGNDFVILFNRLMDDYGKYHQSNKRRSKLPRRVIMKIDQARKVFIQKRIQGHIIRSGRRR